jgi:hypothetical protein
MADMPAGKAPLLLDGRIARPLPEELCIELRRAKVFWRQILLGSDRIDRAFGNTGPTIDASVRIDVKPWPLGLRLAWHDAFDWTNVDAGAIADAEVENYMRHLLLLEKVG